MSSYYLFVEDGKGPRLPDDLADLADSGNAYTALPVLDHGPHDGPGMLFHWSETCRGYQRAHQEWHWLPSGHWIGWEKGGTITPDDLQRTEMQLGEDVELEDGQKWLVPIVRSLPGVFGFDEHGNLVEQPRAEYRDLCEYATEVVLHRWFFQADKDEVEEKREVEWSEVARFAARVLGINYRVNFEVLIALGLLGSRSTPLVARAAVEFDRILQDSLRLVKKNEGQPASAT